MTIIVSQPDATPNITIEGDETVQISLTQEAVSVSVAIVGERGPAGSSGNIDGGEFF